MGAILGSIGPRKRGRGRVGNLQAQREIQARQDHQDLQGHLDQAATDDQDAAAQTWILRKGRQDPRVEAKGVATSTIKDRHLLRHLPKTTKHIG